MTHAWHDTFRHAKTPAHHLDPRSKLAVGLICVGWVLSTPHLSRGQAAAYGALILATAFLARIPVRSLLIRFFAVWPFALLMALSALVSASSFELLEQVLVKSFLCLGIMTVFSMATPFPDLLRALQQSRAPRLFVLFLAFLYRYGAVLGEETVQLERGWGGRYFGRLGGRSWQTWGHVVAALLVRSYERAERVYAAMLARGFSSEARELHVLHFNAWDVLFVGSVGILLAVIRWRIG